MLLKQRERHRRAATMLLWGPILVTLFSMYGGGMCYISSAIQSTFKTDNAVIFESAGISESDKNTRLPFNSQNNVIVCFNESGGRFFINFWSTLSIRLFQNESKYTVHEVASGFNTSSLFNVFNLLKSTLISNNILSTLVVDGVTYYQTSPTQRVCLAVKFEKPTTWLEIHSQIIYFDVFLFTLFITGVTIFRLSSYFCRYQLFYYLLASILSLLLSLFIVCFFLFRLFYNDLKSSIFSFAIMGTFSAIISKLYHATIKYIFLHYYQYLFIYAAVVCMLTSIFIYIYEPIANRKLVNLVKWSMQLVGLVMVGMSARTYLGSLIVVGATVILYIFENTIIDWFSSSDRTKDRKRGLNRLSIEEYRDEAEIETKKAVEDLRNYLREDSNRALCYLNRSCNTKCLKEFIEGADHVTLSQKLLHSQQYDENNSYDLEEEDDSSSSNVNSGNTYGSPKSYSHYSDNN